MKSATIAAVLMALIVSSSGCVIVSEVVIVNSTDHILTARRYVEWSSGSYSDVEIHSINPNEYESLTADIYWNSYLQIWAANTLITKIDFPKKAIATEVKIGVDEHGKYTVHGEYIDIGEYRKSQDSRHKTTARSPAKKDCIE